MTKLINDTRYAIQLMLKHPGFTLVAVLTIALGVGANTALFSVVDAVLLKKLPVNKPDQLVLFGATYRGDKFSPGGFSGSNRRDPATGLTMGTSFPLQTLNRFREQTKDPNSALSDAFGFSEVDMNLNTGGQVEVVRGQVVSGNYYSALGVPAVLGRTINDSDDNPAAAPVAVLSHRYWTTRFGSDPSIIGKQVNLNNVAFTIAGVSAKGFEGTMQVGSTEDVSIPLAWEPQISAERSNLAGAGIWWLRLMGRLKPGATIEQANATLGNAFLTSVIEHRAGRQARTKTTLRTLGPGDYPALSVSPGNQGEMNMRQFLNRPLRLLFGVVALVLLIACANVANLLLVRASSRRKEIAVRVALGASRLRLVRQLLTESILLAVVGGVLGILFALWIKNGLLVVTDWGGREMSALDVSLDPRVLAFTFGLSLLTGIVFGIVPALRATNVDLTPTLKDTGRSSTAIGRSLLTRSLVVVQVTVSVLLLVGAGLLIRSLQNLHSVDIGFNANNLLLFNVDPSLIGYKGEKLADLYERLNARLQAVPGVESVTISRHALLSGSSRSSSAFLPGVIGPDGKPAESGPLYIHNVGENFFTTMQIPLLMGRSLTAQDDAKAPKVAVVNQEFVNRYLPGQNPIGKRFGFDSDDPGEVEIVGVVRDVKYTSQRDEVPPTSYQSYRQTIGGMSAATFEVRTSREPTNFVAGIREAVREIDSNLPLTDVKTQAQQADEILSMERMFAKLLTMFGLVAQALAAVGLYGVMAYSVSQRTHEIGIRMALGANPGNVLRLVLRQGMILTVIGVGLGLLAAFVISKYLESLTSMLFGVKPRDPITFAVIGGFLILVALAACLIPARRATKIDPLEALRYE
ncbi:MAG TPA: ABC transporter permease [Pyrinomonadaceae bacterium]